jgi:sigma-B regulation protein RsbU (phosphoserine phosphatase)
VVPADVLSRSVEPPMPRTRSPLQLSDSASNHRAPVASAPAHPTPKPPAPPAVPSGMEGPGAPLRAFLELRLEGGPAARRVLSESPMVIGRVPGVGLLLDHHTVSRRHAEMVCDPFGRWWIRDLGSTNGTMVGGDPVDQERVLSPGDAISIGDYALTFCVEAAADARETFELAGGPDEDKPTVIRRLLDLEPPRIAAAHLRTLLELSKNLTAISDFGERRDALCSLIVRDDFHAANAVVIRVEGRRRYRPLSRVHRAGQVLPPPPGAPALTLYISRRVLDMLHDSREPVLATNVSIRFDTGALPAPDPLALHAPGSRPQTAGYDGGSRPQTTGYDGGSRPQTPTSVEISLARELMELWVLAVPFRMGSDSMDVLYATVPRDCANAEWLNLYALAGEVYKQGETLWAARRHAQENAAIEYELDTARQIQRRQVPGPYSAAGLDVTVGFEPCKWVGGDYVDVIPLSDGRVLLAVADVCGKGLHAALVGASLHTIVRFASDMNPPLPRLMERVNRHLCEFLPEHSFVTMVAAVVDTATGEMECVNAGHPPLFVVGLDGSLAELQAAENPPLGIATVTMVSQRARLERGHVLAMYTDGLSELTNPAHEMLGIERLGAELSAICAASGRRGVAAVGVALAAQLDAFREGELPGDDRTFLLAQRR